MLMLKRGAGEAVLMKKGDLELAVLFFPWRKIGIIAPKEVKISRYEISDRYENWGKDFFEEIKFELENENRYRRQNQIAAVGLNGLYNEIENNRRFGEDLLRKEKIGY